MLKAERMQLAQTLTELCDKHSFAIDKAIMRVHGRDAGIKVNIDCGKVKAMFNITHTEYYTIHWYDCKEGSTLSSWTFGDVNAYHGRKATSYCRSPSELMTFFRQVFTKIDDGTALL